MPYKMRVRETVVLRAVARALIPFILIFALYVQFHGDFGPGGGFQAGVIFAAGFILYALIFGLDALEEVARPRMLEVMASLGVLIYGGVGIVSILRHGDFLDYGALNHHDPVHGQHLGIMLVELGVGISVAAVMIVIFRQFAARGRE
jgi:multicomponent Na+:H+ antiporter subunit B